jgi:hypothetical protein
MSDTHPTVQPKQRHRILILSVLAVVLAALLPPLVGFILDMATPSSHGALSLLFTAVGIMVSLYLAPAVLLVCAVVLVIRYTLRSRRV